MSALIQSYVCNKWFVSTIYRRSSAWDGPSHYYETMIWEWDSKTKQVGKLANMDTGSSLLREGALKQHAEICRTLAEREPEEVAHA